MKEEKFSCRARLMRAAGELIYRYPWQIIVILIVITGFFYWSAQRLTLKLNFTDMLSPRLPAVQEYKHAVEQFGALSFLFIVLEAEKPEDLETAKAYADELARRLPENPAYVPLVFHKVELADYLDDALLFAQVRELEMLAELAEKNRPVLEHLFSSPSLRSAVEGVDAVLKSWTESGEVPEFSSEINFNLLFGPLREVTAAFKDYALNGPGNQAQRVKKAFLSSAFQAGSELPVDLSEGYIVSQDRRRLLLFVSSTEPAEDFEWCRQFMEYVEGVDAEVSRKYPGVKSLMTGNAAFMRDDNAIIRNDMKRTTVVAFAGIMFLFAFSFRNLSSILMVGFPLAAGIIWAMGSAYWIIGHLTPVTAVFGAILLGMGIDYGILLLSRYTEERNRGRTIKESLDLTLTQIGVSILTGAAATTAAFLSMLFATLKAGQEMGLLAAIGLIMFVFVMTAGVTSILVAWDRAREARRPIRRQWNPRIMRPAARLVDRGALYLLLLLGTGALFLASQAPRYSFEYNYLNLEPAGVESFELVHHIPQWFNIDVNFGMVISHSIEEDRKLAAALRADKAVVSRVDAVSDFIPADQEAKLVHIHRLQKALAGIQPGLSAAAPAPEMSPEEFDRLLAALRSLRDTIGAPGRGLVGIFYVAELEEAEDLARQLLADLDDLITALERERGPRLYHHLALLDQAVSRGLRNGWGKIETMTATTGITLDTLRQKHPDQLERFLGRDGSFMIYVFPSITIWEEQNLKAVSEGLRRIATEHQTRAVGVALLFDEILRQIKQDLVRISALAFVVVFLVLLVTYQGLWNTLLTLLPLLAGGLSMVGIMNLKGWRFNPVNTGMLPLLIGVGVNYGVYVVHRWLAEGRKAEAIPLVVESTGRAVTLSALTTMIGFASIILCQWRGLSLMGRTLTIGIGLCWVAAVFLLPSLLKVISQITARKRRSS